MAIISCDAGALSAELRARRIDPEGIEPPTARLTTIVPNLIDRSSVQMESKQRNRTDLLY